MQATRFGGIVLCGGRSTRMGSPKALLPFGPELMVQRVVRLLAELAEPLVVVAAAGQQLPDLPAEVILTRDQEEGLGPLEGLRAGLQALSGEVDAAYATSCDVPLLVPQFVKTLFRLHRGYQIAVPVDGSFHHPLAAVYSTSVLPQINRLLSEQRLRPIYLYDAVSTRRVPLEELREVDPQLDTLANLNRPEEYQRALARAGLREAHRSDPSDPPSDEVPLR